MTIFQRQWRIANEKSSSPNLHKKFFDVSVRIIAWLTLHWNLHHCWVFYDVFFCGSCTFLNEESCSIYNMGVANRTWVGVSLRKFSCDSAIEESVVSFNTLSVCKTSIFLLCYVVIDILFLCYLARKIRYWIRLYSLIYIGYCTCLCWGLIFVSTTIRRIE